MLEDEIFNLKVEQSLGLGLGWGTFSISKVPGFEMKDYLEKYANL